MSKNSKIKSKIGLAPGSVIYTGEKESKDTFIDIFDYTKDSYEEKEISSTKDCFSYKNTNSTTWVNINGLSNVNEIKEIGVHYNLHPLTLEDIVSPQQRPKMDEYENYLFVIFKMLYYDADQKIKAEHISLILGDNYILSFQEADGDVFDPIRERIRKAKGIVRLGKEG